MPSDLPRRIAAVAIPEGPVLAVAAFLWFWDATRAALAGFLQVYPAIVLIAGTLLAWRFGRPRVLLTLVLLALGERVLHHVPMSGATYAAVAFFLPVDLVLISLVPIRALRSAGAAIMLGVLAVQATLLVVLRDPSFAWAAAGFRTALLPTALTAWTPVPPPALLAFVGATGLLAARTIFRPDTQGRGVVWVLVAVLLAFHAVPATPVTPGAGASPVPAFTYWIATAGLLLIVATLETSHALAYRDGLTGLRGRRSFDDALARLTGPWTIAMVDIDRFKRVNDAHGHEIGDQVLRMVAATLGQVRGGARAYRYGGEEFAILFPGRVGDEAAPHLEAVRAAVEATPFVLRGPDRPKRRPEKPSRRSTKGRELAVTVSIGYAHAEPGGRDAAARAAVVEEADAALYRAKRNGRNRVAGPSRRS